jgi:hypothetical protein
VLKLALDLGQRALLLKAVFFRVPSAAMCNAGMRPVKPNTRSFLPTSSARRTLANRFVSRASSA